MKKNYLIITGIIVVILVVIACSWKSLWAIKYYPDRNYALISWIDCIYIDGLTYTKNVATSTVNESEIDKEIGIVKFELYDSIHYSGYKMKDWDATFLNVNTKLFTIKNDIHSIAALVDGIYYKYTI